MIKRTIVLSNPAYLNTRFEQVVITYPESKDKPITLPIEDIGVLVLENPQLTITNTLIAKLLANNVCIIHCDARHMPAGLLMPIEGHSEQSERYRFQIDASLPLKKNLWQQTITAKIYNQAKVLEETGTEIPKLLYWSRNVQSGDPQNYEAQAAALYWPKVFGLSAFLRHQDGMPPNNLLNYTYAILRAITARALVGSGLLPTLGIFHKNKYNAFCLADDIMEPYRPFADALVRDVVNGEEDYFELNKNIKQQLLKLPVMDVEIDGKKSPLMIAMSRTTHSLAECFAGNSRKILYPKYG
jgi:CRISP-associated protein Cas1